MGGRDVQVEVRIAVRVSDRIDAATLTSETFFLTDEDGDATVPRVDVNRAGNVFVVWRQIWDAWRSVWSNRRDPGTTWMTAERIEDIPETAFLPTIAVDEARHAHALWLHSDSNTNKLRTNRFE